MAERFADDVLAKMVRAHADVSSSLRFEPVPTGHFNTTYFVEGADRPLVLRIAPPDDAGFVFYERGMMAQEPTIHALVRQRTEVPVAEIIAYDTSRRFVDRDFLLMERLPGIPLSQCRCTQTQLESILEQTGHYLRQIHEITSDRYGYLGEHQCMRPQPDWVSAFRIMWGKLVDDVVRAGYYDREQESWAKNLLERHIGHFDRPVASRLLHMDIWGQNILVSARPEVSGFALRRAQSSPETPCVTGLVDFDRALWGDVEIEFAVLDYCGISEPAFWRGYVRSMSDSGATHNAPFERDTSFSARIRRAFYLLYEIQKYVVIYHYRSREFARAERYKQQSLAMMKGLESEAGSAESKQE